MNNATENEDTHPKCHFTKMEYNGGEYNESWWECPHCGHTIEITGPDQGER